MTETYDHMSITGVEPGTPSYQSTCLHAAFQQQLFPVLGTLAMVGGYNVLLWQSGGFTMVVQVTLPGEPTPAVLITAADDAKWMVGLYKDPDDEMSDGVPDRVAYVPIPELLATLHKFFTEPIDLIERLAATFPNADLMPVGYYGVTIPWGNPPPDPDQVEEPNIICVTEEHTAEERKYWRVGIYLDFAWQESDQPNVIRTFYEPGDVDQYIEDITELQPEGTDWGAWAVQWTLDQQPGEEG